MLTRALPTILVCVALAGCAGMPPTEGGGGFIGSTKAKPAKKCNDECGVTIEVDTTSSWFANTLTIKDTELFITVPKSRKPRITWTLVVPNPTYAGVFGFDPAKGIDFGADNDEFEHCGPEGTNKFSCKLKHRNENLTVYKYTVNVILLKDGHGRPKPLDPWVVSE